MLLGPGPSRPHQRHLGQETDWTPGLQPLQSGGVIKWALGSGDPGLNHWYCHSPSGQPELARCLLVCSMEVMPDPPTQGGGDGEVTELGQHGRNAATNPKDLGPNSLQPILGGSPQGDSGVHTPSTTFSSPLLETLWGWHPGGGWGKGRWQRPGLFWTHPSPHLPQGGVVHAPSWMQVGNAVSGRTAASQD